MALAWLRFLRITPWATILRLGYGLIFALGQAVCASIPAPEGDADAAAAALRSHSAWPGSVPTEATVFKQFHRLAGFDYRACAHRFLGYHGPADCAGPRGGRARSASGHAWPHRQLAPSPAFPSKRWRAGCGSGTCSVVYHLSTVPLRLKARPNSVGLPVQSGCSYCRTS